MRIFIAIAFSFAISLVGLFWNKSQHEKVELSLDIGFRALQRLAYDEWQLNSSDAHIVENVRAQMTLKGRQTPVLLEALPSLKAIKLSAIKVSVDEKDEFEPRNMLLLAKNVIQKTDIENVALLNPIQEAPLYVNGKRVADYFLIQDPFYSLVSRGQGPVARRTNGVVELSYHSKQLPIMIDILKREGSKLPNSQHSEWWYWDKNKWVKLGSWPEGWPL